jgi:exopolysaccharide production protein ExoQ
MSYLDRTYPEISSRIKGFPWLLFLFIAAVFFSSFNDLFMSKRASIGFGASEDEIITAVGDGQLSKRISFLFLGLFAVASLIRHRGAQLRANEPLGRTILFFLGWALLSLAWTEDPALTIRRLVVLLILCLAAVAMARRFSLREIAWLTFFCSILFLLIGVSAEVLLGQFHPFMHGYRFAGTEHPNNSGITCALLSLSGFAVADTDRSRRIFFRVCALLGLVFLVLSASRTASGSGLLALVVYLGLVTSRRTKTVLILGLATTCCILAAVLGSALIPELKHAAMYGRDDFSTDALNPRTHIWDEVGAYIQRRPILGYGYGGFWTLRHSVEVSDTQNWGVGAGHSAYLDCTLDLGVIGLTAYVLILLGGVARSYNFYRASRAPVFVFAGSLLIFCMMDGVLESVELQGTLVMFLSMTVLARLAFVCRLEAPGIADG